jgi:hypothetical protein
MHKAHHAAVRTNDKQLTPLHESTMRSTRSALANYAQQQLSAPSFMHRTRSAPSLQHKDCSTKITSYDTIYAQENYAPQQ